MRIAVTGVAEDRRDVPFTFEGSAVNGRPGDTVASAMVNAGILGCRTAMGGDPRGVFCGMGVCSECAVVIDGVPGRLACMTSLVGGMTVERQPALPALPAIVGDVVPEIEISPDVLVVGGGPAGLASALTMAEGGLDVLVVDERAKLGGQFFKQPPTTSHVTERALDSQYREGRQLIRDVEQAGAQLLTGVRIWAAFSPTHFGAVGSGSRYVIRPRRLIVAVGAYERGVALPGWTLPGVMTTGAAQTLMRATQVAPGRRVLVAGNGPLNMQVAAEMTTAGVDVAGVAELADVRWWRGAAAALAMLRQAPALVRRGLRYRATLARARVPVMARTALVEVHGRDSVERATVAQLEPDGKPILGTEKTFDVDAVCVGYGFVPSSDISRALGCRHSFDESTGSLVVERTVTGRTTTDGVWVVGDAARIRGAHVAIAMGRVAGGDVLADLGRPLNEHLRKRVSSAERDLRRHEAFQGSLWRLYRAPVLVDQLATPTTILCRCESVTFEALDSELARGAQSSGAMKRVTRVGMGKCQGRYCGPIVSRIASARSGLPEHEFAGFAPNPPLRPTPISIIAFSEEHA